MITDVSEQISCAIYEVYPDSVSNSFGRLPANGANGANGVRARPEQTKFAPERSSVVRARRTSVVRAQRTEFAADRRSALRLQASRRRFSGKVGRNKMKNGCRTVSVGAERSSGVGCQRLCHIFKNVPRFALRSDPNNDKPTIYKTIDELLAANKITSF